MNIDTRFEYVIRTIMKILWGATGASLGISLIILIIAAILMHIFKTDTSKLDNSFIGKRNYFITPALAITVIFGGFALTFSLIYLLHISVAAIESFFGF